jgi:type I restriction enzyme R subunit
MRASALVIEELIQLEAKKPAIASCDALAENESARQVMGESILRVIAHELVVSIKDSVSVDWMHPETARARMRVW